MDAALRSLVRRRAENRCEYCHIHQDDEPFFRFHNEHIMARQHGGVSDESNLALACHHCNLRKGPNLTGVDPETGQIVPLFHPRNERWADHFELRDRRVLGRTPIGRATAALFFMNAIPRLELRSRPDKLGNG
jgi:HNH endonuclease